MRGRRRDKRDECRLEEREERRETTSEEEGVPFFVHQRKEGAQVTNDDPAWSSCLTNVLYLAEHGLCIRPCCLLYCPRTKGGHDYNVT